MTFQAPFINWSYFLPVLIVVGGGTLVILWDVFFPRRDRSLLVTMTLATLASALGAALSSGAGGSEALSFSGMFLYDGFSQAIFVLLLFSSFMAVLIASAQASLRDAPAGEYFGLILFATSGMMLMAATQNLLMVFVGLEVFSLSLYVLAGFTRTDLRGNEAALKYFLLGSFASGFLLYGMALIYGATGSMDLMDIARRLVSHEAARGPVFLVGLGFVVVGLGFKVAAVPFNMWTPDVYEGAPTAVTAFMSVGPKLAAFAAFFRIFLALGKHAGPDIETVLWVLAALTMVVGNVVAIWQSSVKRMLAYSSIAHAGYLLVALVAAHGGGPAATGSFLFYMLVYTLMNMGAFCVVVVSGADGEERTQIEDYAGMGYTRPVLGAVMALFMLSLAGLPPTGGFVAKFYIFSAAIEAGYVWLTVIAVLSSVVSVFFYLRLVVVMYMQEAEEEAAAPAIEEGGFSYALTALSLASFGVLNLGIFPSVFLEFARRALVLMS